MGKELLDIDGQRIDSTKWYKIMLADGTELGMGDGDHCGPQSSGKGAVVRYRRRNNIDDGKDKTAWGWAEGDVGFIKGIAIDSTSDQHRMHLSLNNSTPPKLLWYESDDSYGLYARQTTGNRIVLYGRTSSGLRSGLRVVVSSVITPGGSMDIIGRSSTYWPLGLDCAFVPVGNMDWAIDGSNF